MVRLPALLEAHSQGGLLESINTNVYDGLECRRGRGAVIQRLLERGDALIAHHEDVIQALLERGDRIQALSERREQLVAVARRVLEEL